MPQTVIYHDTVTKAVDGVITVTRQHSDGKVVTRHCHESECVGISPEDYLDRILSQHLSGTGTVRIKGDLVAARHD